MASLSGGASEPEGGLARPGSVDGLGPAEDASPLPALSRPTGRLVEAARPPARSGRGPFYGELTVARSTDRRLATREGRHPVQSPSGSREPPGPLAFGVGVKSVGAGVAV